MQSTDTLILCVKRRTGTELVGGAISKEATNVYHWHPHEANEQWHILPDIFTGFLLQCGSLTSLLPSHLPTLSPTHNCYMPTHRRMQEIQCLRKQYQSWKRVEKFNDMKKGGGVMVPSQAALLMENLFWCYVLN